MSNETKKYELVKSESIVHNGRTLYRIRALREFTISRGVAIKVGDIGGFVESENNLSQEDICWIFDDAKVYENAIVSDTAWVFGNAKIYGNAKICEKAQIYGNAEVKGDACICGSSLVCNVAEIGKNKKIKNGKYIFKSLNVDETLSKIEPICYKISFAVRVIELKLPVEQGYIESLVSQFAEYNELADSFRGRTYLSPKEKEILAMLSQCKKDIKILKKAK
jgi:NDP-sugar pyrophosphorylase family protein